MDDWIPAALKAAATYRLAQVARQEVKEAAMQPLAQVEQQAEVVVPGRAVASRLAIRVREAGASREPGRRCPALVSRMRPGPSTATPAFVAATTIG